uniref:Uncharacterized protein n=1 Tax=Octopus bimaculoides TaxID=37653 RepID=A0A0L8IE86_OCTBM
MTQLDIVQDVLGSLNSQNNCCVTSYTCFYKLLDILYIAQNIVSFLFENETIKVP